MGFDAPVMMEAIGTFSKESYDKAAIDEFSSRLGITIDVVSRNPFTIRISGEEDDPARSVIKGLVCKKIRSLYGKAAIVTGDDGTLIFTFIDPKFRRTPPGGRSSHFSVPTQINTSDSLE